MRTQYLFIPLIFSILIRVADGQELELLKDITAGPDDSYIIEMTEAGGWVYFFQEESWQSITLWKTDGTPEGTQPIRTFIQTPYPHVGLGNHRHYEIVAFGDEVFFTVDDGIHGTELWKTDGTEEGTVLFKDTYVDPEQPHGTPRNLVEFKGMLFFRGWDDTFRHEVWKSDGTPEGTAKIKAISGQPTSTYLFGSPLIPAGDWVYFLADDGIHGVELWRTDGSAEGTSLVKDIYPGTGSGILRHHWESKILGTDQGFYFVANDGVHGYELWKSEGTEESTYMVKDLRPHAVEPIQEIILDSVPGVPESLIEMGDKVLFSGQDENGERYIWVTDGTEEGTVKFFDENGPWSRLIGTFFTEIREGQFYFNGAHLDQPLHTRVGNELYFTDGSNEGTYLVKDININKLDTSADTMPSEPWDLTVIGDHVYFIAYDSKDLTSNSEPNHGRELWKSDGTEGGTKLIRDLYPGNRSSDADFRVRYGTLGGSLFSALGYLFYFGRDGVNSDSVYGRELWVLKDDSVITPPPPPPTPSNTGRSVNISTRGSIGTGDNVMIGGFIIEGTEPKKVLIRGRGPSLGDAGVSGALDDPTLTLFSGAAELSSNDDWEEGEDPTAIQEAGYAPSHGSESAMIETLDPGAYTVIVDGSGNTTGTGIIEVFDLDEEAYSSILGNISTRGAIGTGDGVMIGGFILGGEDARTVLLRARGPSLESAGIDDALQDPYLRLFSGSTQIDMNDDWEEGSRAAEIEASGLAPSDSRESALYRTLSPGAYTLIVEGVGGTIGTGIVEVFDVTEE